MLPIPNFLEPAMDHETHIPLVTETLCASFAEAADALTLRRANRIPEQSIESFVALGWMDWHGGSLRITPLGHMALIRIRNRFLEAVA